MRCRICNLFNTKLINRRNISNIPSTQEKSASWFYLQSSIEDATNRESTGMSPHTLLKSTTGKTQEILIRNAQFLQSELPVRVAKRVLGFRNLPFIIASNPSLLRVQDLYINTFYNLEQCQPVTDVETEETFRQNLVNILDDHKNVISLLSQGFKECKNYVPNDNFVTTFLDDLLKARLGMRLLCDHHLQLALKRENYHGSFDLNFSPHDLVERKSKEVRAQCDMKYGSAPQVKIQGHRDTHFVYISPPLEYTLGEVLKNSMRAVIEAKDGGYIRNLEPVIVTIVNNDTDFIIRVEDRGAGIGRQELDKVWQYGYTGATTHARGMEGQENAPDENSNIFGAMTENRMAGTLYGYGFGLPVCRAYTAFLGGTMLLETMLGFGTTVYIKLKHLDVESDDLKF